MAADLAAIWTVIMFNPLNKVYWFLFTSDSDCFWN